MIDVSTIDTQWQIEQFLYREARLLDTYRMRDWFALLAEDIRYRVPVIERVYGRVEQYRQDTPSAVYVDHDRMLIEMRLTQFESGMQHSETPVSVTQRIVTNVLVEPAAAEDELMAHSQIQATQVRHGDMETVWRARREDRMRRVGDQWMLAERNVILMSSVLPRTLGIFL
ncbi:aromatic-ring-hydroxylating dioxygenase subunit beta [Stutzerimonas nitrititolerans]|uniref:aromatic-ring-hydroxylating dioxygenase subunit beta n=1 Tax=Stutzerimonas nitrititolerans TaxID=2482751 RepID=UPI00289ECF61|nr:aromatic-ring-hydroxylating dioxygenase subunit beta [Stutzerimonas nitrititolerans]